jgi:DNA polymerase-3 subunit alpha/error-prone DNA polymerase
VEIPLDIPRSGFWFQRRTRCAGNPVQLHDTNSVVALVQKYGMMLEKYPNQRSMHSCGILISEEPYKLYRFEIPKVFPLHCLTCTLLKNGFEKFDILS